jgi:hypothetical protein
MGAPCCGTDEERREEGREVAFLQMADVLRDEPSRRHERNGRPGDRDRDDRLKPGLLHLAEKNEQEERSCSGEGHEGGHDRESTDVPDGPFQRRAGVDGTVHERRVASQRAPAECACDQPGAEQRCETAYQERLVAQRSDPAARETEEHDREDRGRDQQQRLKPELGCEDKRRVRGSHRHAGDEHRDRRLRLRGLTRLQEAPCPRPRCSTSTSSRSA